MGGSSKQVSGYKYFANFLLFIGNPIEKLLGINFDKRGWQTGERVPYGSNGEQITIDAPNLYGENEGGVSGLVYLKTGTDTQTPVEFYQDYLESVSLPALAYPFQSYLAFKDFYLGNSGYMKEMLLWPKRIHIKNDGSEQWYDAKAEIGVTYYPISQNEFTALNIGFLGVASWTDPEGEHSQIWQSGSFPFYDAEQSYSAAVGGNGPELSIEPSLIAVQPVLSANNLQVDFVHGTKLPACTWVSYPPETDGFYSGAIARRFFYTGYFYWFGGVFEYKAVLSGNYSGLDFLIRNEDETFTSVFALDSVTGEDFKYLTGSINLAKGYYKVKVDTGDRYELQDTPRPFVYIAARIKAMGSSASDINPIHKIREILTDDTAMNKPESDVNDANFIKAADRIWDEGLGISWAITEKSCIDAINELCSHIEAGVRVNRQTGLYEIVLFRDDWFEESEIHSLAENKIKSIQIDPINVEDVKNYLNVSYYDRENIKDASFSIAENASIKNAGGFANAESADFPYFMNQRNAAVVAQWKLKQFTTPCWKGTFTTGYNEARKWNRYDIVKLNWSRKGIVDLPVRIMSINLGDGVDNTVSIDFVEVVPFSDELTSTVVIDDKIDSAPLPPQVAVFKAFELPYFEAVQLQGQKAVDDELAYDSDIGYVAVVAQRPQNNSLNAQMHTDAGTGYENSALIQYCEIAKLDQAIDRIDSSFILKNVEDIESVRVGSQIFINTETMVYQAFDGMTKLLTVKRGALDTVPQAHAADSILFFADDFVAADQAQYMDGEIIDVKAITTTPSGVLDLDDVESQSVEIQSRAIRPYPPANVQINGEYWPELVESTLSLTWVNRNRSQQTGGEILGWFESGVTIESGTTYHLKIDSDLGLNVLDQNLGTVNSYNLDLSSVAGSRLFVELKSMRDGYESYIKYMHDFEFVGSTHLYANRFLNTDGITGYSEGSYDITANPTAGGLTFSAARESSSFNSFICLSDTPSLQNFNASFDITKTSVFDSNSQFSFCVRKSTWSASSTQGLFITFVGADIWIVDSGNFLGSWTYNLQKDIKYNINVIAVNGNLIVKINGTQILSVSVSTTSGKFGYRFFTYSGSTNALIENFVIDEP